MGATLGCPTRKIPAAPKAAPKFIHEPTERKPKGPRTKQFEASSLNEKADEYRPPQEEAAPRARPVDTRGPRTKQAAKAMTQRSTPPGLASCQVDPNEPDWAQFLAKKVAEQSRPETQGGATKAAAPVAAPTSFTLHTSDYLKLLKEGEQKQSNMQRGGQMIRRPPAGGLGAPPGLGGEQGMASLKSDLAASLDSIIRSQRLAGKDSLARKKGMTMQERGPGSKDDALFRIAQMLGSDATPEAGEEDAVAEVARDDISIHLHNRDEDLAELAYWSDDDKAPRAIHRASAHKVGKRPLDNRKVREYVTQKVGQDLDRQVATLLLHLRRLNDRHRSFEPAVAPKRRFVVGIKEVFRGVRQGKVKCVVVAPDIEEVSTTGGLDDRVRDILRVAYEQDIPVVFALSRVRMGRSLGKSLRMSVLAVLDTTGTDALYNNVISLAYDKRIAWLTEQRSKDESQEVIRAPKGSEVPKPWAKAKATQDSRRTGPPGRWGGSPSRGPPGKWQKSL